MIVPLSRLHDVGLIARKQRSRANGTVVGMLRALQLQVGERYSIITLLFFVPYIIFVSRHDLVASISAQQIGTAVQHSPP